MNNLAQTESSVVIASYDTNRNSSLSKRTGDSRFIQGKEQLPDSNQTNDFISQAQQFLIDIEEEIEAVKKRHEEVDPSSLTEEERRKMALVDKLLKGNHDLKENMHVMLGMTQAALHKIQSQANSPKKNDFQII